MGVVSIRVGAVERFLPLFASTVVGRDPSVCTWALAAPLFPDTPATIPLIWCEIRWNPEADSWAWRAFTDGIDEPSPRAWKPLAVGDVLGAIDTVELRLVEESAPRALARRASDGSVREGSELQGLVEWSREGWYALDGDGPLREGSLIQSHDGVWIFHPGQPPNPTDRRAVDVGAPDLRVTLDLGGPVPAIELASGQDRVRVSCTAVWGVVPYVRERLAAPSAGWLTPDIAKRGYADERGLLEDEVRTNRLAEDRAEVMRRLVAAGARRVRFLFERQLAGQRTQMRFRTPPERIDIRESPMARTALPS